jgi:hypothetical protein
VVAGRTKGDMLALLIRVVDSVHGIGAPQR